MKKYDFLEGIVPRKYQKTTINVLKGLFIILVFHYSWILQYIPVKIFNYDVSNATSTLSVILSTFSSLIIMVFLMLFYKKDLKVEWKKFTSNFRENLDVAVTAWFIGLAIMVVSNLLINHFFSPGGAANEQAVQSMIKGFPMLMVIDSCILAPFNEEIVFRKTLYDVFKNKYIFILLSFLMFGGAHVISSTNSLTDLLYIIPYGSLGAAFAYIYYKTESVFTSMSVHMLHNTLLVISSIILLYI